MGDNRIAKKPGLAAMTHQDAYLLYWYEHELVRLRAAERAGHDVSKERQDIENRIAVLKTKKAADASAPAAKFD